MLHLRRPWRDGTTAFVFSPLELTEKLAALVMRPRVHHVHFHGVYAPHAAWRPEVVRTAAQASAERDAEEAKKQERRLLRRRARRRLPPRSSWCPWSDLLERVFGAHGFTCPRCGGQMRLRAVVVGPPATRRILAGLARSSRGPP